MNSEKRTYYKCGEIYLVNKNENYTFLCYYCDEIFYEFADFHVHVMNCSNTLNASGKQISSSNFQIKNSFESVHTVLYRDSTTNLSNNWLELEIQANFKENCSGNNISDKYRNNGNANDTKFENNSSPETFCPHCNLSYKINSHDIKKCSKIEDTITKYNGDFIKLLQEGVLYCSQCKKYFEDYEVLYEHHIKAEHCNNDQCKICKFYAFMNSKINLSKQKLKENVDQNSFEISCEKCLIKFISKNEHDLHMQIIHKQSIECENNEYEYNHKNNIESCENGQREFKCSFCKKLFRYKSNLKTHMRIHTNDRPYKCEFCSSAFTVARNLRNHIIYKHTNDKPFTCEYEGCNAKFKLFNLKKQHERRHRPRNFQCEICGNYFINNSCLLNHQQTHKDPKSWRFQCEICQKRFPLHTRVVEHKRRIHIGEKPFGCELCQKFFKSQKDLKEHKKLHSDKNNYICRVCNKGFKQYAGYYSHTKHSYCLK